MLLPSSIRTRSTATSCGHCQHHIPVPQPRDRWPHPIPTLSPHCKIPGTSPSTSSTPCSTPQPGGGCPTNPILPLTTADAHAWRRQASSWARGGLFLAHSSRGAGEAPARCIPDITEIRGTWYRRRRAEPGARKGQLAPASCPRWSGAPQRREGSTRGTPTRSCPRHQPSPLHEPSENEPRS